MAYLTKQQYTRELRLVSVISMKNRKKKTGGISRTDLERGVEEADVWCAAGGSLETVLNAVVAMQIRQWNTPRRTSKETISKRNEEHRGADRRNSRICLRHNFVRTNLFECDTNFVLICRCILCHLCWHLDLWKLT